MNKKLVSVLLVSLLTACATQKAQVPVEEAKPGAGAEAAKPAEQAAPAPARESAAPAPAPAPVRTPPPVVAADPLDDPGSVLAKRSVYYPFDVYVVQDADRPIVEAHASYLSGRPNRKVRLEGNCDERGSNEYNLGLGQRRADGVRKMLVVGGAKESQIVTVSYGEEKPKLTCHEERCWKENRRTDLNYKY